MSGAQRKDEGKLRYDLIPAIWEKQLATILTTGTRKYADNNWKESAGKEESKKWREKCLAALRRHLAEWQEGNLLDPEHPEKVYHMTAVAWNALVIMWYDHMEGPPPAPTRCGRGERHGLPNCGQPCFDPSYGFCDACKKGGDHWCTNPGCTCPCAVKHEVGDATCRCRTCLERRGPKIPSGGTCAYCLSGEKLHLPCANADCGCLCRKRVR